MGRRDLNAAQVIVAIAEVGSFRRAAQELGMPKSSVSRKVAELEERLGVQLIHRTTRSLSLTEAGALFVEQAADALSRLEAAEQSVLALQGEPSGRLQITATPVMGQLYLGPLVVEFADAFPAITVSMRLTDRHVDLVKERVDVAFRVGSLPDSGLVALRIASSPMRLVASPSYLASHGTPASASDLKTHECLLFANAGTARHGTWSVGSGSRARDVRVVGRFTTDDLWVLRQAAEGGLGIARLPGLLVRDAIADKRLVPVLDGETPPPMPLHLVHLGGRYATPAVRAFIDFVHPRLVGELGASHRGGPGPDR